MDQNEITRRCGKLSLSEENGPIAKIDSDLHEKGLKCVVRSLIGIIMENKEVNREAFKSMIPKIWRTMKEVDVELVGPNTFVFRFRYLWDRKRVLDGGPWSFDKQLIILKEVPGVGRIEEVDFRIFPFWIQIYNLPLSCMSREIVIFLGGQIGEVKEIDSRPNGDCLGKFLRVRVMVGTLAPLKRGLRIALGGCGDVDSILLCYERLPNFCYCCG
ncbi:hypothetical protein ACOSQ4_014496 [Xanthoceras sorbifolium]